MCQTTILYLKFWGIWVKTYLNLVPWKNKFTNILVHSIKIKFRMVIWQISWSMKKLSEIKPFVKANKIFLYFCTFGFFGGIVGINFLCTCVWRKYNKYLVNNFLNQHDVFFTITIGYSLIANFDLGKIETAGFRTRSTWCSHALNRKK